MVSGLFFDPVAAAQVTTVTLTSPGNLAVYGTPAKIPLAATASPASGNSISRVEFLNGTTVIGSAVASPTVPRRSRCRETPWSPAPTP